MSSSIVAWTFDADYHCIACAEQRYPQLAIFNAVVLDREGNECHPVFSWEEGWEDSGCGDCHEYIKDTL